MREEKPVKCSVGNWPDVDCTYLETMLNRFFRSQTTGVVFGANSGDKAQVIAAIATKIAKTVPHPSRATDGAARKFVVWGKDEMFRQNHADACRHIIENPGDYFVFYQARTSWSKALFDWESASNDPVPFAWLEPRGMGAYLCAKDSAGLLLFELSEDQESDLAMHALPSLISDGTFRGGRVWSRQNWAFVLAAEGRVPKFILDHCSAATLVADHTECMEYVSKAGGSGRRPRPDC